MPENLFFIAIVPPSEIAEKVEEFKQYVADFYQSKHALKSPPHITLIPPFWWAEEKYNLLKSELISWTANVKPFRLTLNDFNCFKPRVLFVDISNNIELRSLHNGIKNLLIDKWSLSPDKRIHYNPHMTIAFKDLKPRQFFRAWDYFKYKKFQASFMVNNLCILKHVGGRWLIEDEISLAQSG